MGEVKSLRRQQNVGSELKINTDHYSSFYSNGVISIGLYTTLKEILSGMNLHSLVQMIEQVEQTIQEWMVNEPIQASIMSVEQGGHLSNKNMLSFNWTSFPATSRNTGAAKSVDELDAHFHALRLEPPKLGNLCSHCAADGTYSWAVSSCEDCDNFLCRACADHHRAKRHNLQLIATSALDPEAKELLCVEEVEHGRLDSFCQDCEVLFCTKCCLKIHDGHRCCTFHDAVAAISKEILEAHKTGDKVLAKLSSRKREAESMQETRRVKAEALKQEIEQTAAMLLQNIKEKRNQLLQEVKTYVRNEELADVVCANQGATRRLATSMQLCGQLLSTSVTSPEKVKVLKNTLEQVKKACNVTDEARCIKVKEVFPRFVDCAKHMKEIGLGFLKPFSRAVKAEDFNVTISPSCFLYSVVILSEGSCAALGTGTPDTTAKRALFFYSSKNGCSQRVIKAGVGLAVDMIFRNGELVVLRKEKPYVKIVTPDGCGKSYDIDGDLVNPWSIGIDIVGRIIITHGTVCEKLALVSQGNQKRLPRSSPARDAPRGSEMKRPLSGGSSDGSVDRVVEQHPNSIPVPTGAVMNPDAGFCLGPGRLSCEKEIYCAFDSEIHRYTVNGREIIQTRSGEHDIKDFTIHGVKACGEVFVIGEWWEEVRVYEVLEPSDGGEGWDLKRIPLCDQNGNGVELAGRSGICFDIKDNIMLIGFTDADDRGHLAMFRLGPV
ncbi:uncharacterized protein LOC135499847 isoform X2 [Lineus longissimus]|uniref:uncharacterized protein LOC135499847 isoform X2 n=1 Tax=Lineus longissimus TaxID=88925 RepID=UPI00315C7645